MYKLNYSPKNKKNQQQSASLFFRSSYIQEYHQQSKYQVNQQWSEQQLMGIINKQHIHTSIPFLPKLISCLDHYQIENDEHSESNLMLASHLKISDVLHNIKSTFQCQTCTNAKRLLQNNISLLFKVILFYETQQLFNVKTLADIYHFIVNVLKERQLKITLIKGWKYSINKAIAESLNKSSHFWFMQMIVDLAWIKANPKEKIQVTEFKKKYINSATLDNFNLFIKFYDKILHPISYQFELQVIETVRTKIKLDNQITIDYKQKLLKILSPRIIEPVEDYNSQTISMIQDERDIPKTPQNSPTKFDFTLTDSRNIPANEMLIQDKSESLREVDSPFTIHKTINKKDKRLTQQQLQYFKNINIVETKEPSQYRLILQDLITRCRNEPSLVKAAYFNCLLILEGQQIDEVINKVYKASCKESQQQWQRMRIEFNKKYGITGSFKLE